MSGFKTDNNSGDIYYDDVEYTVRKVKKAKISTAAGTNPGTVDINLSYQNTPGSNDYTVDSKISLVPGDGLSFSQNSGDGTITLIGTPKNNLAAAQDPTRTDDNTQGYATGSFWVNTSSDISGTKKNKAFLCTSALTGNAVWTTIDKMTVKSAAPTANNDGGSPDGTNADRGYAIGSFWLDITTQTDPKLYVCVSNAVNGASWKEVGASSGPQVLLKTANPLYTDADYASSPVGTIWINTDRIIAFIKTKAADPNHYWKAASVFQYNGPPGTTYFPPGSFWFNMADSTLWYCYSNSASPPITSNWAQIGGSGGGSGLAPIVSADAPTTANKEPEGTLWIESDTDKAWISVDQTDGIWQLIGKTIVSTSAPTTLNKESEGTLWVKSDTDKAWISVDQAAGTWKLIGDGLPAGNHTEVQFNKNNEFGASSNLVYTDWEAKGGALKQKVDSTNSSYNYYGYKTVLSSAGRAHFYSHHVPCTFYYDVGVDGNNVPIKQDMDPYRSIHLIDATAGSIQLELPAYGSTETQIGDGGAGGKVPAGHILTIKRVDYGIGSSGNAVAIQPGSGVLIDGFSGTPIFLDQRKFVTLYLTYDSNTSIKNWIIISA